jgi:hypothetical protein
MLDRLANFDEQIEPFLGGEIGLITVIGDLDASHQFHHEVGAANPNRSSRRESALTSKESRWSGLTSAATELHWLGKSHLSKK